MPKRFILQIVSAIFIIGGTFLLLFQYFGPPNSSFKLFRRLHDEQINRPNFNFSETSNIELDVADYQRWYLNESCSQTSPSIIYIVEGYPSGFASIINNLLNAYILAHESSKRFHILIGSDFFYKFTFEMLDDFSSESDCPIVLSPNNVGDKSEKPNLPWQRNNLKLTDHSQILSGPNHIFIGHWGMNFLYFRANTQSLFTKFGLTGAKVFTEKQILTQSLFRLKPTMQKQIKVLRSLLFGQKPFIAVHIRRGDKVNTEMKNIPISKYADEVLKVQRIHNETYPFEEITNVFVFSDDDRAVSEFDAALHNSSGFWRVESWINGIEILQKQQLSLLPKELNFTRLFSLRDLYNKGYYYANKANEEARKYLAHELISTLMIASMCTHLVCTYSSNICRLLVLLRNTKDLTTTYSLDSPEWYAMKR